MRIRVNFYEALATVNVAYFSISALPSHGWAGALSCFVVIALATVLGWPAGREP